MRFYFGSVASALVFAALCGTALSWDGSRYLFHVLDAQSPFVFSHRYSVILLHWPIIAMSRFTSDVRILRLAFGLLYAAIPLVALVASWWIVRKHIARLFVWAALGIGLGTLPGQIFFVSEAIISIQLFWPILLAICTQMHKHQLPILVLLAIFIFFAHPVAIPLFVFAGCLAFLVALRSEAHARSMRLWAVGFFVVAGFRLVMFFLLYVPYEASELTLDIHLSHFKVAVAGLPLKALTCGWLAGMLVLVSLLLHQSGRVKYLPIIFGLETASLIVAGALLVFWARDPDRWKFALDFRDLSLFASLPFMLAAGIEGFLSARGLQHAGRVESDRRLKSIQIVGLVFTLVLFVQSTVWFNLRNRLNETVVQSSGACTTMRSIEWLSNTPLYHWSTPLYTLLLQGRAPKELIVNDPVCDDRSVAQVMSITPSRPSDLHKGWFDISHLK